MNAFVLWSEHFDSCMWSGSERGKDWREGISVLNSQTRKYLLLDWNYWNSLLSKTHLKTFSSLSPSIEGCSAVIESLAAAGWEGNWRWGPSAQGCWWQHQGKADWERHLSAPGACSPARLPSSSARPQLVTALPGKPSLACGMDCKVQVLLERFLSEFWVFLLYFWDNILLRQT